VAFDGNRLLMTDPENFTPSIQTLRDALSFFLEDDNLVDRLEAEGLKILILRDGIISEAEKQFLTEAIQNNNFDSEALKLLQDLLKRNPLP
jgi:sulfur transfer complex TusBCD TusB component (DsrH family)